MDGSIIFNDLRTLKRCPFCFTPTFRLAIVKTYTHRCTCCGIKILTADGHTIVEAAHIIPFS
ncbi:MAG TPA: hypothetical protein VGC76_09450, partial [Pyrinomonadaceae bacterium]